jgi:hypothetical protein
MSFKLNGAPYNKDDMNIAVYRRDLKDGSAGKSNHTGIIVDKDADANMEKAVVAHETVHQHQQRDGELDYDKNNFYWKGKVYPRENLNEHNEDLPWEKDAYKASNGILNGKNKDMRNKFELKGHRGNNKAFKALADRKLIGGQDGASVENPPKKGSSIEKLKNSVKYKMAQNPGKYGIKPGDRESKYLDSFKKDIYYKGRQKDEAAALSGGKKKMQQAKKDVTVKGREVNKGVTTDKERIEGRKGEFSDMSILTNTHYDKHGDKDYSKIGAPRDSYKLKGNVKK